MSKSKVNVYAMGKQSPAVSYTNRILQPNMVGKRNILEQDMLTSEDTRYIIRWDYDLDGKAITIPANSVLMFDGGSFYNGTVYINGAGILPDYDALAGTQNMTVEGYPKAGVVRWDADNERPVWSTGSKWVNALGGDNF